MKNLARLSLALLLCAAGAAQALDKVIFLTNWFAEAEHGGTQQQGQGQAGEVFHCIGLRLSEVPSLRQHS